MYTRNVEVKCINYTTATYIFKRPCLNPFAGSTHYNYQIGFTIPACRLQPCYGINAPYSKWDDRLVSGVVVWWRMKFGRLHLARYSLLTNRYTIPTKSCPIIPLLEKLVNASTSCSPQRNISVINNAMPLKDWRNLPKPAMFLDI